MYFKEAGEIIYDNKVVTNITKRTNFIKELLSNPDFYFKFELKTGDTPETTAFDWYGDPNDSWIIYLANSVYDPLYQWYITYAEVIAYSKLKYGDPAYQQTQYWVFENVKYPIQPDITIDPNGLAVAVSNLDYEVATNDDRRFIKIIYPEYVNQIKAQYEKLV